MTLTHLRPYRMLRIAITIARVLPRYAWLVARERIGHAPSPLGWERAHVAAARGLRDLALSLGGAITKAAQIGGARADVLPRVFVDELSQFHDAVPARPLASLRASVERDLASPLESVFAAIEPTALAAASLAQVHRATLRDGSRVVVKIQYPEARRIIPLDLRMLRVVARLVRLLQSHIDLRSLVFEVSRFIELELDFEREVDSMERLRTILLPNPDVVVPRVHRAACGDRVIVMERLDGIQIGDRAGLLAAGHRASELARKIGALYGSMIFEVGFFHGDPHPGNLLVLADGRIGLLDFGLCKQLPKDFGQRTAQLIVCALIGDTPAALEAAAALGFDIDTIRADHLRSLFLLMIGDSDGENGFLDVVGASQIRRIPEDFALVARTLVLLNGLSHRLAPKRRLIQAELLKHLAASAARANKA